jgi:hypothetical protein
MHKTGRRLRRAGKKGINLKMLILKVSRKIHKVRKIFQWTGQKV